VHADGNATRTLVGIDADLTVRPFMAKGFVRTIREQNLGAFPGHLGIDPTELAGSGSDSDGDGVVNELDPGRLTAVVAYQAMIAAPSFHAVSAQAADGLPVFTTVGCASCHTPILRLDNPTLFLPDPSAPTSGVSIDLTAPVDVPRLSRTSSAGPVLVPLFSDLKRHDMGPELADPIPLQGVPAQFTTTPLWGLGSTAPYLHDGRATDIDSAIRLHGGEGAAARDAYVALSDGQRSKLIDFLSSLVLERGSGLSTTPPGVSGY
jgi:CxxC motif-containing protein (DUF1111 family)